jgi:hypothetical protein
MAYTPVTGWNFDYEQDYDYDYDYDYDQDQDHDYSAAPCDVSCSIRRETPAAPLSRLEMAWLGYFHGKKITLFHSCNCLYWK